MEAVVDPKDQIYFGFVRYPGKLAKRRVAAPKRGILGPPLISRNLDSRDNSNSFFFVQYLD